MSGPAKAIEARRAATLGAVHESAWAPALRPHLGVNKTIPLNALSYAGRGSMEGETA